MNTITQKIPCTVEVLTRNSEATLNRCLDSIKDFAEIIILDGNSTDRTRDIAGEYGCRIYPQYENAEPAVRISDYAEVRNKGLGLSTYTWFMYIDSDEYLSSEAVEEIRRIVTNPNPIAHVWWQPRKYVLHGTVIECATTYPNQQVRLFNRDWVRQFIKSIHERIDIKEGANVGTLASFEYVPLEELGALRKRWQRYLVMETQKYSQLSKKKIVRLLVRQCGLFIFYALRYVRNGVLCRGPRLPFRYEWARHSYIPKSIALLIKAFVTV